MMKLDSRNSGGLRYKICPDCGDMHDIHNWPGNHRMPNEALAAPTALSDCMDPIQSQGNGKMYDSKSALRQHYKQDGFVEVGNDPARNKKHVRPKPSRKEIKTSLEKAEARVNRGERIIKKS